MLPGNRTYSDEDIKALAVDALYVFDLIDKEGIIPDDLRVSVFSICHTMVGNRTLPPTIIDQGKAFPHGGFHG